jgi:hypothetical protein
MSKTERLAIEAVARSAVGREFGCAAACRNIPLAERGPVHEFDVYAQGVVIGGVSTSPLKTGGGNSNTGGCDRACSELLWLSLWPGPEARIHVLTDRPLANWLVSRFRGAVFPHQITIYFYDHPCDRLTQIGMLSAPGGGIAPTAA